MVSPERQLKGKGSHFYFSTSLLLKGDRMEFITIVFIVAILVLYNIIIIVPQEYAYIKERFGVFVNVHKAGFHFMIPIVHRIHYKHNLKEIAYDVPPQECITKDNVSVEIDGILYIKVADPYKASYGIDNYLNATTQLAKTTLRAEIGKLELDETFSERETINRNVVRQIDQATDPWGIKVTRYEIKNISPPQTDTSFNGIANES